MLFTFSATLHITDCIFTHRKLRTNNLIVTNKQIIEQCIHSLQP